MTKIYTLLLYCAVTACSNGGAKDTSTVKTSGIKEHGEAAVSVGSRHYRGAISNGMKGDSLFFNVSADGKRLENLTFKGYWRCSGKLEQTIVGPDGGFEIKQGRVAGHITEPPDGGSTAWRFELEADLKGLKASGNFRMNINNLGCDTYKLKWIAEAK